LCWLLRIKTYACLYSHVSLLHTALQSITNAVFLKNTFFCPAQILLGGVTVDQYNNILLQDEELASMRQGRDFLSQINDGVPKTLTSMKLLARTLEEGQKAPLTQGQFETVVLSVAFSAHQAYSQKSTEEREAWGEVSFHAYRKRKCVLTAGIENKSLSQLFLSTTARYICYQTMSYVMHK
uniref:Uncharacterized protein n=1 Tax=Oryzias latipes TaxID=8090 RepID=A0A3P9GZF8_ORYLA